MRLMRSFDQKQKSCVKVVEFILYSSLNWAGFDDSAPFDINVLREQQLERLADALEMHLDIPKIFKIIN